MARAGGVDRLPGFGKILGFGRRGAVVDISKHGADTSQESPQVQEARHQIEQFFQSFKNKFDSMSPNTHEVTKIDATRYFVVARNGEGRLLMAIANNTEVDLLKWPLDTRSLIEWQIVKFEQRPRKYIHQIHYWGPRAKSRISKPTDFWQSATVGFSISLNDKHDQMLQSKILESAKLLDRFMRLPN